MSLEYEAMTPSQSSLPTTLTEAWSPAADELLDRVDFLRLDAAAFIDPERQALLGQFMTPAPVARLMASMFEAPPAAVRLLDPGAGVGSLLAAWVAEMCGREAKPTEVVVTAFEIDPFLASRLRVTLELCQRCCDRYGIRFGAEVREEDFVGVASSALAGHLFTDAVGRFECAILNPPYKKISADSVARHHLARIGRDSTNLYTAFLSLAGDLLVPGGQLVAITPRSFCNGAYFGGFRRQFLDSMSLRRVHSFETRDRAFREDDVLQENVILAAVRLPAVAKPVVVSSAASPDDPLPSWHEVQQSRLVDPTDQERILRLPADGLSEAIEEQLFSFASTALSELGLVVSTGPVVDFRVPAALRADPEDGTVPLLYPSNMIDGQVLWPRPAGKKPRALLVADDTRSLLIRSGWYVVIKRFTAKEERRRVVAAVLDPGRLPKGPLALENHLNYIHAQGDSLPRELAEGLALYLNSTIVDLRFREWSGHTQVNATDLRRLRYPTRERLVALGRKVLRKSLSQDDIDSILEEEVRDMPTTRRSPVRAKKRVLETVGLLKELGLPREQQNERSALTLLALLDLRPSTPWQEASNPLRGITEMMGFFEDHYGKVYAPNTRETVRRHTVHQFVQAGFAFLNPDQPTRPTNSPGSVYQVPAAAVALFRLYGTSAWGEALCVYQTSSEPLGQRYAQERDSQRISLTLPSGLKLMLSAGGQNPLVKAVVEEFCSRFTPGGILIYVGDTSDKWVCFERERLEELGVKVDSHGKMPDVVVLDDKRNWLVLVECVTSHGPISPKRHQELRDLFAASKAGLVFVTAFLTRRDLTKYLRSIAWETEVWVAESPSHMIHFNGERFLGPF